MKNPSPWRIAIVLAVWAILSFLLAQFLIQGDANKALVFLAIFFLGLPGLALAMGAIGIRWIDEYSVAVRKNVNGQLNYLSDRNFFYMPFFHDIVARLPLYKLRTEFRVEKIDTNTTRLQKINAIDVRVTYYIVDPAVCYSKSVDAHQRIEELIAEAKLTAQDAELWKRLLDEVVHGIVDDRLKDTVWNWEEVLTNQPHLRAFPPPTDPAKKPEVENDPYALSKNRLKLAGVVLAQVQAAADEWGLEIDALAFERFDIDEQFIKTRTRNKPGEIDEATHEARKSAAKIIEEGKATGEVRVQLIDQLIAAILKQKPTISDESLHRLVRAALGTEDELILEGIARSKGANGATAGPKAP